MRDDVGHALLVAGHRDLEAIVLDDIAAYVGGADRAKIERRCTEAVGTLEGKWHTAVQMVDCESIERFYDSQSRHAFHVVTAVDVFEHPADSAGTVNRLSEALNPGGFLYARIASEDDSDRPRHFGQDFGPMFHRLRALGVAQVWDDEWPWGHELFHEPGAR